MTLTFNFDMETYRCATCGSWWAFEKDRAVMNMRCPRCTSEEIRNYMSITRQAEMTASSLRGVITKLKLRNGHDS